MIPSTPDHKTLQSQAGFVSMFTLLFFIVVATIVTVGFLRLVLIESQQAQNNSSSNSALAAARAGIEDGKRVILLYKTDPAYKTAIDSAISSSSCDAIYSDATISGALDIDPTGRVKTDGLEEQYYTCMKITMNTTTYEAPASTTKSVMVPLDAATGFSKLRVSWHNTSGDKDGGLSPSPVAVPANNPDVDELNASGLPTFMRMQLIKVPNTTTPTGVVSATGFFKTSVASAPSSVLDAALYLSYDYPSPGVTHFPKNATIGAVSCNGALAYACSVTLNLANFNGFVSTVDPAITDVANNRYFLRLTPMHSSVQTQVEMLDASDTALTYEMVQPEIDVTGKSGNTLRRLKARVKFTPDTTSLEYVVEAKGDGSDGNICKAFQVGAAAGSIAGEPANCQLPDQP